MSTYRFSLYRYPFLPVLCIAAALPLGRARADGSSGVTGDHAEGLEYRHLPTMSRFSLDTEAPKVVTRGWERIVSSHGVFATSLVNGSVIALPNADAPALTVAALSNLATVHNNRVLQYFMAAGLPTQEISGTHVTTQIKQSGTALQGEVGRPTFVSYTTHIDRSVSGIPVLSSRAWATFNANDEVVAEEVFWPAIPADVVAKAKALQTAWSDPSLMRSLRQRMTAQTPETPSTGGQVAIIHTPATYSAAVTSAAVVEIMGAAPMPRMLHFDINGDRKSVV